MEYLAELTPAGIVARGLRGHHGQRIGSAAAPGPAGTGVALPAAWLAIVKGYYVAPLVAQLFLARGEEFSLDESGRGLVGGNYMVSTAGNLYNFSSKAAGAMWASINKARAVREVELAEGMTAEKRAVWLAKKREKLEIYAGKMLTAAAKHEPGDVQSALIQESEFARSKWGHYAG